MRITVHVPKEENKWEASWGNGGHTFKRNNYSTLRKHAERKIRQHLASHLNDKIDLIVDYGQFHLPRTKNTWINESTSTDSQKALLDLDYFVSDFL